MIDHFDIDSINSLVVFVLLFVLLCFFLFFFVTVIWWWNTMLNTSHFCQLAHLLQVKVNWWRQFKYDWPSNSRSKWTKWVWMDPLCVLTFYIAALRLWLSILSNLANLKYFERHYHVEINTPDLQHLPCKKYKTNIFNF